MKTLLSRSLISALLACQLFAPSTRAQNPPAAAPTIRNIPFNHTLRTVCAEKRIRLSGEFRTEYTITRDAGGDTFIEGNLDAGKISGLGLTSRAKYEAVGTGRLESRGPSPTSFTYVFNFALNKSGTTDSLMAHVKFRINVDAGGRVTTSVAAANIDCTK
ncbi:MAG TPA: hypothetical protein VK363_16545 [Pyrinomonadaceae bacterium]|nr:hypothetical protein [Pyrinomonadaceae bacterium]